MPVYLFPLLERMDMDTTASTLALDQPAVRNCRTLRRRFGMTYSAFGKECREACWFFGSTYGIGAATENSKIACQARDEIWIVLEPGAEHEADWWLGGCRSKRVKCHRERTVAEAVAKRMGQKSMGRGSLQRIGVAKAVCDQYLEPCTPGGLGKCPPGQRCDEDRLAAQSVTQGPSVAWPWRRHA